MSDPFGGSGGFFDQFDSWWAATPPEPAPMPAAPEPEAPSFDALFEQWWQRDDEILAQRKQRLAELRAAQPPQHGFLDNAGAVLRSVGNAGQQLIADTGRGIEDLSSWFQEATASNPLSGLAPLGSVVGKVGGEIGRAIAAPAEGALTPARDPRIAAQEQRANEIREAGGLGGFGLEVADQLPQLGATFVTGGMGGTAGAMSSMAVQSFGAAMDKFQSSGLSEEEARLPAARDAAIETLTELLGDVPLVKALQGAAPQVAGRAFELIQSLAGNFGQEYAADAFQQINEGYTQRVSGGMDAMTALNEAIGSIDPSQSNRAGLIGATIAGGTLGPKLAIDAVQGRRHTQNLPPEVTPDIEALRDQSLGIAEQARQEFVRRQQAPPTAQPLDLDAGLTPEAEPVTLPGDGGQPAGPGPVEPPDLGGVPPVATPPGSAPDPGVHGTAGGARLRESGENAASVQALVGTGQFRSSDDGVPLPPVEGLLRGQRTDDQLRSDAPWRSGPVAAVPFTTDPQLARDFAELPGERELIEARANVSNPFSYEHAYPAARLEQIHPRAAEIAQQRGMVGQDGTISGRDIPMALHAAYAEANPLPPDATPEQERVAWAEALHFSQAALMSAGYDATFQMHRNSAGQLVPEWALMAPPGQQVAEVISRQPIQKPAPAAQAAPVTPQTAAQPPPQEAVEGAWDRMVDALLEREGDLGSDEIDRQFEQLLAQQQASGLDRDQFAARLGTPAAAPAADSSSTTEGDAPEAEAAAIHRESWRSAYRAEFGEPSAKLSPKGQALRLLQSPLSRIVKDEGVAYLERRDSPAPTADWKFTETAVPYPPGATEGQIKKLLVEAMVAEADGPPPAVTAPTAAPQPEPAKAAFAVAGRGHRTRVEAPGFDDGIEVEYALVEADAPVTSHDDQFEPDARFPQKYQNRQRSRASNQEQVRDIAVNTKPQLLVESIYASDGAPIVAEDGIVEAGNGRLMGIRKGYREGTAGSKAYRQHIRENAARLGLDPAVVDSMRAPVLVRVRKTELDDAGREAFARGSNDPRQAAMSQAEVALDDAKRMPDGLLDLIPDGAEGDLGSAGNRQFIREFIAAVIGPTRAGELSDASGNLSQAGLRRVQAAVFAKAFGDPTLVGRTLESADDNTRRVGNAMISAAPAWARMRAAQDAGHLFQVDPTEDVVAAVKKLADLRRQGTPVETYIAQQPMFDAELSPPALRILGALGGRTGRSQKKLSAYLGAFVDLVEGAGAPNQVGLFGEAQAPDLMDLLARAEEMAEAGWTRKQGSLLEDGSGGGLAAKGRFQPSLGPTSKTRGPQAEVERTLGETAGTPGRSQRLRLAMPELVELAEGLLGGRMPEVRKKLGRALGRVLPRPGGGTRLQLRADIFKDMKQALATLAHEIGHVVDYLPEEFFTRGNLLGRIAGLKRYLKHTLAGMHVRDVRRELLEVSEAWRPGLVGATGAFKKYRESGEELYADAFSMLLNDPDRLERMAPTFFHGLMSHLDAKPEFRDLYNQLTERGMEGQEALDEHREERAESMLEQGAAAQAKSLTRPQSRFSLTKLRDEIGALVIDKMSQLYRLRNQAKGAAKRLGVAATRAYEEWKLGNSAAAAHVADFAERVLEPLEAVNVSVREAGALLFYARVAKGDRQHLANPLGITPTEANRLLERLEERLGKDRLEAVTEAIRDWRENIRRPLIESLIESGAISPQLAKTMRENSDYATFDVVKHMEKEGAAEASGWGAMREQIGTFERIGNPLLATVLKDIAIQRLVTRTNAVTRIGAFLERIGEAKKAKRRWAGRGLAPVDPHEKGKKLITYMQGGQVHGYVVSDHIAAALSSDPGRFDSALRAWDKVVGIPLRATMVTHNPGFALWNIARDQRRTFRNTPGFKPILRARTAYSALIDAITSERSGKLHADEIQMLREGATYMPGKGYGEAIAETSSPEDAAFELLAHRVGISEAAMHREVRLPLVRAAWRAITRSLSFASEASERASKLAAYRYLREAYPEMATEHRAEIVRNRAGTPNTRRQAVSHHLLNRLFMFSTVAKEGTRGSFDAARENPGDFIAKTALMDVLPALLSALATMGLLGDDEKEFMEAIPETDKSRYHIIPFGWTADGKAVYGRIPMDYEGMLVHGVARKMALGTMKGEDVAQLFAENSPWSMGSLSPVLSAAFLVSDYAQGKNPRDEFRGRDLLTRREFEAGGAEAWKKVLQASWNEVGGSLYRFNTYTDTEIKSELEQLLGVPLAGPFLGRFVKVSDAGKSEKASEALRVERQGAARAGLARDKAIDEALRENPQTNWSTLRRELKARGIDVYERESYFRDRVEDRRIQLFGSRMDRVKHSARSKRERAILEEGGQ